MSTQGWKERGFERGGEYHIERGDWKIARCYVEGRMRYTLYRGREMFGVYPDAHEAAVHADMVEAGKA